MPGSTHEYDDGFTGAHRCVVRSQWNCDEYVLQTSSKSQILVQNFAPPATASQRRLEHCAFESQHTPWYSAPSGPGPVPGWPLSGTPPSPDASAENPQPAQSIINEAALTTRGD